MTKTTAEQIRLASLMLGSVDCVLRLMKSDGLLDPAAALRGLLRTPPIQEDAVAVRYGHMARALRGVFTYRRNHRQVDRALDQCIGIAASLL